MDVDNEFVEALSVLGLNEKESQLYHYLLKYGAKTPSIAARYLKTYREDVHRTLLALIDRGLVTTPLSTPTMYKAVSIDTALEEIRQQRVYEQHKIQETENKLLSLSAALNSDIPDDFHNFKMYKNVKEGLAAGEQLIRRAKKDIVVIPPEPLQLAIYYGLLDAFSEAQKRGVTMRAIINVTGDNLNSVGEAIHHLEVRHYPDYGGMRLLVTDGRDSLTAINANLRRHSLDETMAAFWCDSPTYARYLTHIFEIVWEQSIDGAERLAELSNASQ